MRFDLVKLDSLTLETSKNHLIRSFLRNGLLRVNLSLLIDLKLVHFENESLLKRAHFENDEFENDHFANSSLRKRAHFEIDHLGKAPVRKIAHF